MADYTGSIGVKNFHLLNSEGESYEPFEEIDYRVIGIYKSITSSYEPGYFALDENAVIVPAGSIKNSEENNIVADGPMQHHNTSFQIPNGTIESYMEKWNLLGINNIEINFYDRNFTQLQAELKAVKNAAILLLLLGLVSTLLIAVVYVYLSIVKGKRATAIERACGVGVRQCAASMMGGLLVVSGAAAICGATASYMWAAEVIRDRIMANSRESLFDLTYSNWVRDSGEYAEALAEVSPSLIMFTLAGLLVLAAVVCVGSVGIRMNLKNEPLKLLSSREG